MPSERFVRRHLNVCRRVLYIIIIRTAKKPLLKAAFGIFGRSERIRTFDPLHPMQVRYQTAPHSDSISFGL